MSILQRSKEILRDIIDYASATHLCTSVISDDEVEAVIICPGAYDIKIKIIK